MAFTAATSTVTEAVTSPTTLRGAGRSPHRSRQDHVPGDPGHRCGRTEGHVLTDRGDRFDVVLEALEEQGDWVTNRVVYGKLVLGRLGDIEAGVRQLIRLTPL